MPKIGNISWQKFEKFLFFVGCEFKREKGDHRIYRKTGLNRPVVVPRDKILPEFIILKNLKTLGITRERYLQIINKI